MSESNIIKKIEHWFEAAVPNPTENTLRVQMGVHFEEVAEMFPAIGEEDTPAYQALIYLAEIFKTSSFELAPQDDLELLDSLCDQIVTAIGIGRMKGFDMHGALCEVARSNASKFVNGKPIFNEHGKIQKGPSYSKPNLKPFIKG